ncbi:DUF2789 domain-containing protein [Iodobacter sp.]|uniref:DUF2789 domain-containing protein n=1 Tax=Iodobacter sp. TaxID=1915058 RepID=UPI0025E831FB|nr:DUF2789 domain-containing protein [Iodobacter sp.]
MEKFNHHFRALFQQLGLPASDGEIAAFIQQHSPLAKNMALPDADFWSVSQSQFLREQLADDADWAEVIDQLDVALR